MSEIDLGITADMHVHLRDGSMSKLITPTVRQGGIAICYVMPNLVPPITTKQQVVDYKHQLEKLSPKTTYLMSFYLSKELTPELIEECAKEGLIHGIKCYPAGVTTNSKYGVDPNDFTSFYPLFEVMQKHKLILNIHGEKPSTEKENDINVINAEPRFLPALKKLHQDFPKLKIVLEHCTTKSAVDLVREINSNHKSGDEIYVGATITVHHMYLIIDNWAGNPINFCKPVAKFQEDRDALVDAATSGEPWFFFGSDSAPHPIETKQRHVGVCAGVYTQSHAIAYVAEIFDKVGKLDNLKKFVSEHGISFYGLGDDVLAKHKGESTWLVERENKVPEVFANSDVSVVPFKAGDVLKYAVEWR
ncbi:URA4 [[Candida] subhashii]|uniref:dihydroorotase n=1 Tax=[Candida] subhashii TaxID=561895 RepID=A0A8J5QJS3_9ASCO|nr:URA4 [[Candida] subhashii]KAG7664377.1 URA4 [[Candida] subhashii]